MPRWIQIDLSGIREAANPWLDEKKVRHGANYRKGWKGFVQGYRGIYDPDEHDFPTQYDIDPDLGDR